MDKFRLKLKFFLFFIFVQVLTHIKLSFFPCNNFSYPGVISVLFLFGLLATIVGYAINRPWAFYLGITLFAVPLARYYFELFQLWFGLGPLSPNVLFLNILVNLPSMLLTTFVYVFFLLYVISTKSFFKGEGETTFHKVMFVLVVGAFIGSLLIFYQNVQADKLHCPIPYSFSPDEMFATPENTIVTDLEAYYKGDIALWTTTGYYSDNLKRKLESAGISWNQYQLAQQEKLANVQIDEKVDRVEFTNKKVVSGNEVYLEYTVYYQEFPGFRTRPPEEDFAHMINIGGKWKINVEPEYEDDFLAMGIS
jgi:hypothetical protein